MKKYLQKLKDNGFKITSKRKEILNVLMNEDRFMSPEDLFSILKNKFSKVSLPSIYKNLEEMHEIGVLARISRSDRRLYYAVCKAKRAEHHHHIICTKCGKVGEFNECDILKKKIINGFEITGHILQLEGLCRDCRK